MAYRNGAGLIVELLSRAIVHFIALFYAQQTTEYWVRYRRTINVFVLGSGGLLFPVRSTWNRVRVVAPGN